jgi:hypothetical protein
VVFKRCFYTTDFGIAIWPCVFTMVSRKTTERKSKVRCVSGQRKRKAKPHASTTLKTNENRTCRGATPPVSRRVAARTTTAGYKRKKKKKKKKKKKEKRLEKEEELVAGCHYGSEQRCRKNASFFNRFLNVETRRYDDDEDVLNAF